MLVGCRRNDLVETELRNKELMLREARADLQRSEAFNEALQRELGAFRHTHPGGHFPPPEVASPTFTLKRITLGRGTGGYDGDNRPGDEALQVVVEPRDGEDHVVKVTGSLHVTAIEINPQGLKRPLCWWSLTPEQLRANWKQGLLTTGYTLVLPWTVFPQTETIRVLVQFKLADGRCFEADKDLRVRLLPTGPHPHDFTPPFPAPVPSPVPVPVPVPAVPNSFVIPSSGAQETPTPEFRWTPAPLTGVVELAQPQPLSGPAGPLDRVWQMPPDPRPLPP
jgi:hypothetical protein